jgi:hypothetical protein
MCCVADVGIPNVKALTVSSRAQVKRKRIGRHDARAAHLRLYQNQVDEEHDKVMLDVLVAEASTFAADG